MAAPSPVIAHGALEEQTGGLRWRLRNNDFDSVTMSIESSSESFLVPGSPMPGYPHMRCGEVQPEQQGDVWSFANTEFKGFKSPTEFWRKFSRSKNSPSEGFDSITLSVGVRGDTGIATFARGATLPTKSGAPSEFPNMFIMDITEEETDIQDTNGNALYFTLNLQLRGLLGPKPYTRRCNGAAQTFTPDVDFEVYDTVNELGETVNGWSPAESFMPAELSIAKLVLTDSFVTLTEPPFGGIPGNITPEDAPAYTDLTFWTSGSFRYHWPFGWRRANIQSEKLPGKDVWAWSVTYEFQQKVLPG
mgnify:FL=1